MAVAAVTREERSTSGLDLKRRRVVAFVTQGQLAAALGVSRQRVSHLEAEARPAVVTVDRYLAALEQLVQGDAGGG